MQEWQIFLSASGQLSIHSPTHFPFPGGPRPGRPLPGPPPRLALTVFALLIY